MSNANNYRREPVKFESVFPPDDSRVVPARKKPERTIPDPATPPPAKPGLVVIKGLVREIKGTQFRLWDCPVGNWYRCRGAQDYKIIAGAHDCHLPVAVTVEGKQVNNIEEVK